MQKIKTYFKRNLLLKNSIYLIITNGFVAVTGFVFWIIVARIYPTYQIGIATSLLSLVNLLSTISLLGFNTGLLRYLPNSKNKSEQINTVMLLTSLISGVLSFLTLFMINKFAPALLFVRNSQFYFFIFIVFTILTSLNQLQESVLVALRSSNQVLYKSVIYGVVKLIPVFFFIRIGGFGIFSSIYIGILASVLYGSFILNITNQVVYKVKLSYSVLKSMAVLSVGTYISNLTSSLPTYLLPIIISYKMGPSQTAYYYMASTIINILNIIPQVVTQNLLVEGSYDIKNINTYVKNSLKINLIILLPIIALLFYFGDVILFVFGKQYSIQGFTLLKILSLSVILAAFNYILGTILTIYHHIPFLVISNILSTILLFVMSIFLLNNNVIGIGYATLVSEVVLLIFNLVYLLMIKRHNILKLK